MKHAARYLFIVGPMLLVAGLAVAPVASCGVVVAAGEHRGPLMSTGAEGLTEEGFYIFFFGWMAFSVLALLIGGGLLAAAVMLKNKARAAARTAWAQRR